MMTSARAMQWQREYAFRWFSFFRDFDIGDGLLNRRLDDGVKIALGVRKDLSHGASHVRTVTVRLTRGRGVSGTFHTIVKFPIMPTPFESAQLNLQLFDLRREAVLREARNWFLVEFNPGTLGRIGRNSEWPEKLSIPHGTRLLGHGCFSRHNRCN
jgi:hypothetical protein